MPSGVAAARVDRTRRPSRTGRGPSNRGRTIDDSPTVDGPSEVDTAVAEDSPTPRHVAHRRRVALILFLGLACRLGVALTTANPDGLTLAWGSSLLASGHANPYQEVIENPKHDPIPVEQISAVSLAQGPIGVAAGAVTMGVARAVGLIHYASEPDGTAFRLGELVAYKLSFLVPEALIIAALVVANRRLRRDADPESRRGTERWVLLAWAANPLVLFTWGQGMPDTWTVAVILWAVVAMVLLADGDAGSRVRLYSACAALIPIGSFGTKMMPIVTLVPLAVLVARDDELGKRRRMIVAAGLAGTAIGAAPYVLSRAVWVNVLDRFELNMLNSKPGIPTLHAMPDAQFSLLAGVAVTLWLFTRREPRGAVVPWTVAVILSVAALSNIIPHLLFWASAPLLLLAVWRPTLGAVFSASSGLMVLWHLLSYSWLANLVTRGLDWARAVTGQPFQWVSQNVPAVNTVGGVISSVFVLVAVGISVALLRGTPFDVAPRTRRRLLAVGVAGLVLGLGANVVLAERQGVSRWEFGRAATSIPFSLDRGDPFTTPVLKGGGVANKILFKVEKTTFANSDMIRVEILDRNENRLTMGEVPVWVAEPASEKVGAEVSFAPVAIDGVKVRFSRIAVDGSPEVPVVLSGSVASVGGPAADAAGAADPVDDAPSKAVGDANSTRSLTVIRGDDEAAASTEPVEESPSRTGDTRDDGVAEAAQQQIAGPIFRLREDRSGDVPGLLARRLLGPAGWVALLAAGALGVAGAVVVVGSETRSRRGRSPR